MMNKPIVIVGFEGRMSLVLQQILTERNRTFKILSPKAPGHLQTTHLRGAAGLIDFSKPELTESIALLIEEAKVPWICGTTGYSAAQELEKAKSIFARVSQKAPVVWDSNFSLGIELLCQAVENWAQNISEPIQITDIHHQHKKDAPSGTALKIEKRFREFSVKDVQIKSIREGEVPGEHRVLVRFGDETLEVIHQASSRKPFAEGAVGALDWAVHQKPGLYTMKDILKTRPKTASLGR